MLYTFANVEIIHLQWTTTACILRIATMPIASAQWKRVASMKPSMWIIVQIECNSKLAPVMTINGTKDLGK